MNNRHSLIGIALLLLLLLSISVVSVSAQGNNPTDDEVNAIARELYCPVCENVPLDVCPTQACEQWRATIREKLVEGWNEQQIKDYFVEQYGARVLATPPAEGLNWLVYVLPPVAFLAGAAVLFQAIRSWRTEDEEAAPSAPALDRSDVYVELLEEEIRKRERGTHD
ncbi:MAG: cytochrome c-type biogenesis protein CcmH [Anaerolineales bacterium]|jgi:cytochrome c-type biogenesis protein CcmH